MLNYFEEGCLLMSEISKINGYSPGIKSENLEKQVEDLANKMESNFTDLMVKEMRKSIPREELNGAQSFYEGLIDREYSEKLAAEIDLGIRDQLREQMGMKKNGTNRNMISKKGVNYE